MGFSGDSVDSVVKKKKSLPANAEDLRYLSWEDSLEKEMATHSSILFFKLRKFICENDYFCPVY